MKITSLKTVKPMVRVAPLAACVAVGLVSVSCITSPVWNYGQTKAAKALDMPVCENGLIDDGEDGDSQIVVADGRDGYWFTFMDAWGSTMENRKFEMVEGGYAPDSKYAAHMKGKLANQADVVYAGMGFAFTNPKTPFDISKASAVRFWAKGPGKIRFKITDRNTDPSGDRCDDCYNDFGVDIYLQDKWVRYTVPFDQMRQKDGWGDRAPAVDQEGAFGVQWHFDTPGADYDVWVDQIEFVGCINEGGAQ